MEPQNIGERILCDQVEIDKKLQQEIESLESLNGRISWAVGVGRTREDELGEITEQLRNFRQGVWDDINRLIAREHVNQDETARPEYLKFIEDKKSKRRI